MHLNTVSIVIPVFNEKESLSGLVGKLEKVKSNYNITEYIFVDDGSSDGSFETLNKLRSHTKRLCTIIRFRKNLGKSAALSVGFSYAKGDYIVTLDADLQDEPAEIPTLLAGLDSGSDMVIGWRKQRHDSTKKRILSKVFNGIVAGLYHLKLHDMNSGLKVMRREVAAETRLYGELHRFLPVLATARGFNVTEVAVSHHLRKFGKSKYNGNRIFHAFFDLASTLFITTFEHQPMQIFGPAGAISILTGIVILIYLSVLHFMGQTIFRRPLLQLGILFVLFGMQMVSTGLIGELIIHKRHEPKDYPISQIIN